MKNCFVFFLLTTFSSIDMYCQSNNLVLNPSFEEYYDTSVVGIASFRRGWVTDWSDPNFGSSDIFIPSYGNAAVPYNTFGFEYPHQGLCYAGMLNFIGDTNVHPSEYIQAGFIHPLQNGQTYIIRTYVSSADLTSSVCYSDLGFYMSDTQVAIHSPVRLPLIASTENNTSNLLSVFNGWQLVTALYTAHGGEKYLSIGTFKAANLCNMDFCLGPVPDPAGQTVYLYIDDVAVIDTNLIDTVNLCSNDSILIGGQWRDTPGLYYDTLYDIPIASWVQYTPYEASKANIDRPFVSGDSVAICLLQTSDSLLEGNFIWIKRDTVIDVPMYSIHGCDSIIRYHCRTNVAIENLSYENFKLNLYPNPANDFLQITINKNDINSYSICVIDITGKQIISQSLSKEPIDISSLTSGMYFVKLLNSKTGKFVSAEKFVKE